MNFRRLADRNGSDEGLKLHPYLDSEGYWTIGKGNRFVLGEPVTKDTPPLKNEAAANVLMYAALYQAAMDAEFWYDKLDQLPSEKQEVIVEMSYQLGLDNMMEFKETHDLLAAGDYAGVARHMRNSLWFRQAPARVERLAVMMES